MYKTAFLIYDWYKLLGTSHLKANSWQPQQVLGTSTASKDLQMIDRGLQSLDAEKKITFMKIEAIDKLVKMTIDQGRVIHCILIVSTGKIVEVSITKPTQT